VGDWTCRGCGFSPNFARRRNCFGCRRQRSPRGDGGARGASRGGGISQGPISANGLRPILGKGRAGWGTVDEAPTYRVPGASVAARAAAGVSAGTKSTAINATGGAGQAAAATTHNAGRADAGGGASSQGSEMDDDGFQVVRGRYRKDKSTAGPSGTAGGPNATTDAEPRAGRAGGGAGEADHGEPADEEVPPSPSELHQVWQEEVALVKRLRQQGLSADHPVMAAACGARDEAECRWREAKDPTPTTVRLSRAQAKLDKAIALQAESRQAIIDHERAYKERLAVLQGKLEEDAERVRVRRRQLEEVQGQLGGGPVGAA
jgi:hypothetical protein